MSLATRAIELVAHLPPARTRAITVRRDLEIPMSDGITLLADRYRARDHGMQPVILMRSPYGRGGLHAFAARIFAERGFQVVVQSCRARTVRGAPSTPIATRRRTGSPRWHGSRRKPGVPGRSRRSARAISASRSGRWRPIPLRRCAPWRQRSRHPGCARSPIRVARSRSAARSHGWNSLRDSREPRNSGCARDSTRSEGWRRHAARSRCSRPTVC